MLLLTWCSLECHCDLLQGIAPSAEGQLYSSIVQLAFPFATFDQRQMSSVCDPCVGLLWDASS